MKQYFKETVFASSRLSVLLLLSSIVVTSLLSFSVKTYSDDVMGSVGLSRQSEMKIYAKVFYRVIFLTMAPNRQKISQRKPACGSKKTY
jgi:hypothetical protein